MDSRFLGLEHREEALKAVELYDFEMPEVEPLVLPPIFSPVFFVVGTGRCGTTWLSEILSTSSFAAVHHEPNRKADRISIVSRDADLSLAYIQKRRQYVANALRSNLYYGEVNGYLQYHIDALRKVFNANIFLLVRNGADVVRSWFSHDTFDSDGREKYFKPEGETRFEKLCWWWASRNELSMAEDVEVVRLEDLASDWAVFDKAFGFLSISKAAWLEHINVKANATGTYALPLYDRWTPEQKRVFSARCGSLMRRLGYSYE